MKNFGETLLNVLKNFPSWIALYSLLIFVLFKFPPVDPQFIQRLTDNIFTAFCTALGLGIGVAVGKMSVSQQPSQTQNIENAENVTQPAAQSAEEKEKAE